MRRIIVGTLLITALAACSGGGDSDDSGVAEAIIETGIPPEPDQATADAYIAALDAIDPAIDRDDPESAIGRGRDQCSTIKKRPGDRAYQVSTTQQRFTSPDHPDGWPAETAEQILDVVHQHLCPSY